MNYRSIKTSKSSLIKYHVSKSFLQDIVSKKILNLSKDFVRGCKSFLNSLFTPTRYVYDDVTNSYRSCNDNCYFRDVTDLQLKASQRTFL